MRITSDIILKAVLHAKESIANGNIRHNYSKLEKNAIIVLNDGTQVVTDRFNPTKVSIEGSTTCISMKHMDSANGLILTIRNSTNIGEAVIFPDKIIQHNCENKFTSDEEEAVVERLKGNNVVSPALSKDLKSIYNEYYNLRKEIKRAKFRRIVNG